MQESALAHMFAGALAGMQDTQQARVCRRLGSSRQAPGLVDTFDCGPCGASDCTRGPHVCPGCGATGRMG